MTLELGGKSPNIFFADIMDHDDAFFNKAVEGLAPVQREPGLVVLGQLGDAGAGRAARQRFAAERFWPPTGRITELTLQEPDDRVGHVVRLRVGLEVGRIGAATDQGEREVADDLAARGHLDHVAQDAVRGGVGVLDRLELLAQAERDGLLAQVRQLPTGNLVVVHPAGGGGQAGLERRVEPTDGLPVGLEVAHGAKVQTRCARGEVGRADQR